jgi:hypothetical protein
MKRLFSTLALGLVPLIALASYPIPTGAGAAHTFPFSMIGQLLFDSAGEEFVGSGTVVQPQGALTAAHNLYDEFAGWSTNLVFKRGHYDDTDLAVRYPSKLYVLAGYQANTQNHGGDSLRAFTRDMGGLWFSKKLAAGSYLGWTTDISLVTGTATKLALGYGAETHSGEQLLRVYAASPFKQTFKAFYESTGTQIEGGMSGGPLLVTLPGGDMALCGVVVSGAEFPIAGGVRIMNWVTSEFISTYLSSPLARQ